MRTGYDSLPLVSTQRNGEMRAFPGLRGHALIQRGPQDIHPAGLATNGSTELAPTLLKDGLDRFQRARVERGPVSRSHPPALAVPRRRISLQGARSASTGTDQAALVSPHCASPDRFWFRIYEF